MTVAAILIMTALAGDWPQFLGPTRDGVYSGADIAPAWPSGGPPVVWKKDVGEGFAGPVVWGGGSAVGSRSGDRSKAVASARASEIQITQGMVWIGGVAAGRRRKGVGE